jgi:hypothetical protein
MAKLLPPVQEKKFLTAFIELFLTAFRVTQLKVPPEEGLQ